MPPFTMNSNFARYIGRNPSQGEWYAALALYENLEAQGLSVQQIAEKTNWPRGTTERFWSLSRELRGQLPVVHG